MSQNTSHAVMAQRHEPPNSLDDFPTPPWATRALCDQLRQHTPEGYAMERNRVWDPACGEGRMVLPLAEYYKSARGSDIHDYGQGYPVGDFLAEGKPEHTPVGIVHSIVTNPPFNRAEEFVHRAFEAADNMVAVLARSAFAESIRRYKRLFEPRPPHYIFQFTERVPMVKGRLDPRASSATSYAWFVWFRFNWELPTRFLWIPPCRKRLERPGDYDAPLFTEVA